MSKWIRKLARFRKTVKLVLPRALMNSDKWKGVTYVIVSDHWGDRIVIEKAVFDEDAEEKGRKGGVGPDRRIE
jgi:hypothetical protein